MTTAQAEQSVHDLIVEAMERIENPDPAAVAAVVLPDLDPEAVKKFAERGIAERVRDLMSRRRRGGGPTHSARFAEVARQQESGELDLARIAVFTGAEHRWLPDCSADDLEAAAAESERQAEALRVGASKYLDLAGMVRRKRGAKVVADLPADRVRGILNA